MLSPIINKTIGRTNSVIAYRLRRIIGWSVWIIVIIFSLSQLEVDMLILFILFGLVGLAIVLSTREILSNVIMEYFLISNQPFKLGDWIQVGEYYGRVVLINYMNTLLITPKNEHITVPNSLFSKEIICNLTTEEGISVSIPVTIDKNRIFSEVEKKLYEISEESANDLIKSPTVIVKEITKDTIRLEIQIQVLNPVKKDVISSQILRKMIETL